MAPVTPPFRLARAVAAGLLWSAAHAAFAAKPPAWTQPVAPFRIAPGVYYVGTKGLSAYLIVSQHEAVLLDPTLPENAGLIERNIRSVGVPLREVKFIVSDHAHDDHVGAMARLKADAKAEAAASAADAAALERGEPVGDTDYVPKRFAPVKVDRIVGEGESLSIGRLRLTAHLTPGHTPGCTSWSTVVTDRGRRLSVLFLCSLTVAGNRLAGNRAYPTIIDDYERTFAKLSTMKADIVLTSHPEIADVLGREARVRAGDRDAFIDPALLTVIVARSKADFEAAKDHPRSPNP
jgi:metallo-beta-lactamase class B